MVVLAARMLCCPYMISGTRCSIVRRPIDAVSQHRPLGPEFSQINAFFLIFRGLRWSAVCLL